jgi:uncharacterized protein (TIGR03435 family)
MKTGMSMLLLLAAGSAVAQPVSFEVASVRPVQVNLKKFESGTRVDAGRVDMTAVSLADIVCQAYRINSSQLRGPDWISSARFDIHAKLPDGAGKEQVPEMLQSLLAERFKLVFHRESKELPVVALLVGKGGPKLEAAEPDAVKPPVKTVTKDAGMHTDQKMTMAEYCNLLSKLMNTTVLDMTGLTGTYHVVMDIPMDDIIKMKLGAEAAANPTAARPGDAAADPAGNSAIFAAVQQLGLKLESRKAPMDLLLIDHAEKSPTEN